MTRYSASDPIPKRDPGIAPLGVAVPLRCEQVTRETDSSRYPCNMHGNECVQFVLRWATADGTWVFDRIKGMHAHDQRDGTLNKGKVLCAAMAGLNPYSLSGYWIDHETGEYGFQPDRVEGQLRSGMAVAAELKRQVGTDGEMRLRVARYVPIAGSGYTPSEGAQVDPRSMAGTLSQDGRWRWSGAAWEPVGDGQIGSQAAPPQQSNLL